MTGSREHIYRDEDGKGFVARIDIEAPALVEIVKTALAPGIPDYMEHDDQAAELLRRWLLGEVPDYRDTASPFYGRAWFQMAQGIAGIAQAKKASHHSALFRSFPHWLPHGHRTPAMTGHPQDRYAVAVIWPPEKLAEAGTARYAVCYFNSGNPPYDRADSAAAATERMDPRTRKLVEEAGKAKAERVAAQAIEADEKEESGVAADPTKADTIAYLKGVRDNPANSAVKGNPHHIAKWNRVLVTLGEDIAGVSPMPPGQIRANAARWPDSPWARAAAAI